MPRGSIGPPRRPSPSPPDACWPTPSRLSSPSARASLRRCSRQVWRRARRGGLDPASAAELLRSAAPGQLRVEVAQRIMEATGGNPLALVEMASEAHRFEATVGYPPLPVPITTTVERAYL